ncbi:hypothetical protein BDZ91DRAFT_714042 [Kalaharituber pfeilii]|nr:hypothetical protein BDZ91DRAFT_714042 [Kalaharituber pfeilii]
MVFFWPFGRRDDNSPDSFERVLAKLTNQIQSRTSKLNSLRIQSRRYKALWTLYTIIAWMFYMIVLVLVIGWHALGVKEIGGAVGGPIAIYLVRKLLVLIYDRRIASVEQSLAALITERDDTIEKLKTATKFYSTQSLLEKYGGGSEMTEDGRGGMYSRKSSMAGLEGLQQHQGAQSLRLRQVNGAGSIRGKLPQHLMPPALNQGPQQQQHQPQQQQPPQTSQQQQKASSASPEPESLSPQQLQVQEQLRQQQALRPISLPGQQIPSAQASPTRTTFSIPPHPPAPSAPILQAPAASSTFAPGEYLEPETAPAGSSHRWYDRLLDILIGEDETAAKARYALICSNCRMVNGLAPPGTKSLDEIGRWGCARCGTMNGKDNPLLAVGKGGKGKGKAGTGTIKEKDVKDMIEREIAEEMLANSVKRGSGRSRGSIRGWTKQIQDVQAQQDHEEGEESEESKRERVDGESSEGEEEVVEEKPKKKNKAPKAKR